MSSRFVSGGTTDAKTGDIVPADPATSAETTAHPPAPTADGGSGSSKKSEEWAAVQAQLDEERRRRQQQREAAQTAGAGEKSLFDVLQANKAAKQAAFEEASKLKNQFRALDDDEVEFLDGVRERTRLEEERLRRETEEGLRSFRELQQKASAAGDGAEGEGDAAEGGNAGGGGGGGGGWTVARKRKRKDEPQGVLKGLKRRSSPSAKVEDEKTEEKGGIAVTANEKAVEKGSPTTTKDAQNTQAPPAKPATSAAAKAGLVDYGSDDDSD
ncbi:hypothetical protein Daus18300_008809 [Diaporthe australafricana]|uniref:FAM192A/Fyv6 N-terminal domain-containing protein n=1 Tax=Diaporthe australafricana TaxID=127596 RepID=A0ABR3WGS6_9PEZI